MTETCLYSTLVLTKCQFICSLLNRLIELEANRVVAEMRKEKPKPINPIKKFFRIP